MNIGQNFRLDSLLIIPAMITLIVALIACEADQQRRRLQQLYQRRFRRLELQPLVALPHKSHNVNFQTSPAIISLLFQKPRTIGLQERP